MIPAKKFLENPQDYLDRIRKRHQQPGRVQVHVDPVSLQQQPTTDQLPTVIMPAVQTEKTRAMRFTFRQYRRADDILIMLYSAVVNFNKEFHRLPDALFISSHLIGQLAQETQEATGQPFHGFFAYPHKDSIDGKIKRIQVFSEALLPDLIVAANNGREIDRDSVICLLEN